MTEKERLMQGLSDAGCSAEASSLICALYAAGDYEAMLRQMRRQRCELLDEMHESQRKIDRMDYLIRSHGKRTD